MRLVLQRVSQASVQVRGRTVAAIDEGMLLLIGIGPHDEAVDLQKLACKLVDLRIFEDEESRMNRSLREIKGAVLAVSQFTLYGDVRKGRRPSFTGAAIPEKAEPIFGSLVQALRKEGVDVQTGEFGAKMEVQLTNSGPVTLVLEVAEEKTNR